MAGGSAGEAARSGLTYWSASLGWRVISSDQRCSAVDIPLVLLADDEDFRGSPPCQAVYVTQKDVGWRTTNPSGVTSYARGVALRQTSGSTRIVPTRIPRIPPQSPVFRRGREGRPEGCSRATPAADSKTAQNAEASVHPHRSGPLRAITIGASPGRLIGPLRTQQEHEVVRWHRAWLRA